LIAPGKGSAELWGHRARSGLRFVNRHAPGTRAVRFRHGAERGTDGRTRPHCHAFDPRQSDFERARHHPGELI